MKASSSLTPKFAIDELREAIKTLIDEDTNSKDKTTLINFCTASLIHFRDDGFSRQEIRDEVVLIVNEL